MLKTLRLLFCVCLIFWAAQALAEPKTLTPREEAAQQYAEAEKNYKLQKYQEALEGFQKSYALSNEASILFNIAQCYRLLGRLEESKKTYLSFLRDVPDSPIRANVETRLAEVEAEIKRLGTKGSIQISSKQDPAEVFLNGESKGKSPITLKDLEPGDYQIILKKQGFADSEVTVSVKPSATSELKNLQLSASTSFPVPTKPYLLASGAFAGSGALAAGGFFLFSIKASRIQDDLGPDLNGDLPIKEKQDLGDAFSIVSTGLFFGAVGVLSAGVIAKLRSNQPTTQE